MAEKTELTWRQMMRLNADLAKRGRPVAQAAKIAVDCNVSDILRMIEAQPDLAEPLFWALVSFRQRSQNEGG